MNENQVIETNSTETELLPFSITKLANKSLLLTLTIGVAPKDMLKDKTMTTVHALAAKLRLKFYDLTAPWDRESTGIIDIKHLNDVRKQLDKSMDEFDSATREAVKTYSVFNSSKDEQRNFANRFYCKLAISPLETIINSDQISEENKALLNTDLEERIFDAIKFTKIDLVERVHTLVNHLLNKLTDFDGKLHESVVSNVTDMLKTMERLNLTNDPQIIDLIETVSVVMKQIRIKDIRMNETERVFAIDQVKLLQSAFEKVSFE